MNDILSKYMRRPEKNEDVEGNRLSAAALADLAVVHTTLNKTDYAGRLFKLALERLKEEPSPGPIPELLIRLQMGELFFKDLGDPIIRDEAVQNFFELEKRLIELDNHPLRTLFDRLVGIHEFRLTHRYRAGKKAGEIAAAAAQEGTEYPLNDGVGARMLRGPGVLNGKPETVRTNFGRNLEPSESNGSPARAGAQHLEVVGGDTGIENGWGAFEAAIERGAVAIFPLDD